VYSIAFASMRMLTGGHFLSDVIFAAIFTGLVIWTVHGFLFRWPPTRLGEETLNAMLAKLGRSVTRIFVPVAQSRGARPDKQTPPV
jgi:lipid A 4'-phosphatase